jgi:hypothetical protein
MLIFAVIETLILWVVTSHLIVIDLAEEPTWQNCTADGSSYLLSTTSTSFFPQVTYLYKSWCCKAIADAL